MSGIIVSPVQHYVLANDVVMTVNDERDKGRLQVVLQSFCVNADNLGLRLSMHKCQILHLGPENREFLQSSVAGGAEPGCHHFRRPHQQGTCRGSGEKGIYDVFMDIPLFHPLPVVSLYPPVLVRQPAYSTFADLATDGWG